MFYNITVPLSVMCVALDSYMPYRQMALVHSNWSMQCIDQQWTDVLLHPK